MRWFRYRQWAALASWFACGGDDCAQDPARSVTIFAPEMAGAACREQVNSLVHRPSARFDNLFFDAMGVFVS